MLTLQHTLVTLLGLRGDEKELEKEIQFVLLPDAIRRYCGPRQYSHFEKSYDGKDVSWMQYPLNLKGLNKEETARLPQHLAEIKSCDIGEPTQIDAFEEHNIHLPPRYFAGAKKHLVQDCIFDRFIRDRIDCSEMYDNKYKYDGQEYDGKGARKIIADIESHGIYILAHMVNKFYGITANQEWFDKHVKARLDEEYSQDLSDGTYHYMNIPEIVNERITNGDWSHLDEGPLPYAEYLRMYEEVIKEMPKIDFDRMAEEERIEKGLPARTLKKTETPIHTEQGEN